MAVAVLLSASATGYTALAASSHGKRAAGPVVQLTYWNMWSGIWEKVIERMVADFNATHPNIHVNVLSIPANADTKLLTAIAAGDPPDVFTEWNPEVGAFAAQGALMNENQFMVGKYAGMKKWFYPSVLPTGEYQGKVYAVPWTMGNLMIYYNKTLMKEAGLNPAKPPTTWAQFNADQAKLWKFGKDGVVRQIGYYANSWDNWCSLFNVQVMKNGKYDLTNPNALKLMNWIASFKKYPFSQVNAFISGVNGGNGGVDPFVEGKQAFLENGIWEIPSIQQFNPKLQYGVFPMPAPSGGNSGSSLVWGNYQEIPKGAKHPQQAWEFIAWLLGYHNEKWAAQSFPWGGWIPSSPAVTVQPLYQKWLDQVPVRKKFLAIMNNPKNFVRPNTTASPYYQTDMTNAVNYVLQGKETPLQALTQAQNDINAHLHP